jgi:hypothetical protein
MPECLFRNFLAIFYRPSVFAVRSICQVTSVIVFVLMRENIMVLLKKLMKVEKKVSMRTKVQKGYGNTKFIQVKLNKTCKKRRGKGVIQRGFRPRQCLLNHFLR